MNIEDYREEKSHNVKQLENEISSLQSSNKRLRHRTDDLQDHINTQKRTIDALMVNLLSIVGQVLSLDKNNPISIQLMQSNARAIKDQPHG